MASEASEGSEAESLGFEVEAPEATGDEVHTSSLEKWPGWGLGGAELWDFKDLVENEEWGGDVPFEAWCKKMENGDLGVKFEVARAFHYRNQGISSGLGGEEG